MLYALWNIVAFIITFDALITIHELGHLLIARYYGVQVDRFSVGFGKVLLRYIDHHGTEFVVALIPIGGYVKMSDSYITTPPDVVHFYTFNKHIFRKRAAIIAAGPIANLIFAIFAYWIVFMIGIPGIRPVVEGIIPNSVAERAHIIPGMEIKNIDGIKTPDWYSVRLQLLNKIGHTKTTISVSQFGSLNNYQKDKLLDLSQWSFEPYKEDPVIKLGIYPRTFQIETVIKKVQERSAAHKAGFKAGDKIIKVNGQPLKQWIFFVRAVRDNLGKPLVIDIERKGNLLSLTMIPNKKLGSKPIEKFAGIIPKMIPLPNEYKIINQYTPLKAITKAMDTTWQLIRLILNILSKLIVGDIKINNLSGPISIAHEASISAKHGIVHYLMFLALMSINIGIINLLPIPILDGGHLLFLLIEKLKGQPISKLAINLSYGFGAILIMLLMGLALFNDFSKL